DDDLLSALFAEEAERIGAARDGDTGALDEARALFWDMTASDEFQEFLTLPAYQRISADAA
ncbi:MAG: malate synthase A, partial [Rhodospirillaceae bacterium]|nr:malate synthase A [Rhodospirillaceae bacterium]